ncbi:MAG TPA: GHKL domain-containing protein [Sphaerochaeta sp.]|nr:GHKL domain-containing protein [Sphaerochaeta sp.]
MTPDLLNNLLRGSVTAVMNALLLFTLTQSKYGKNGTIVAAVIMFVTDITSTMYLYFNADLTAVSHSNLLTIILLSFLLKPLSKSSIMQWAFSYLTTINIMMMIVILSFKTGMLLPFIPHIHSLSRLVLYLLVIFVFHRYLLPLYRSAVDNWPIFSVLVLCLSLMLSYPFYATTDIIVTLQNYSQPLLLLIFLAIAIYGTIFYSLKQLNAMHALETENLSIQYEKTLLSQAASTMVQRLELMDKIAEQNNLTSHDRRHVYGILLQLLQQGETQEAMRCLELQLATKHLTTKVYCENKAVNAVTGYYAQMAVQYGIQTTINLKVPAQLPFDSLELALVIANLFENAIQGVLRIEDGRERVIQLSCVRKSRLIVQVVNPCTNNTILDSNGLPATNKEEHGIGTRSIVAFSAAYNAELLYSIQDGQFRVQLLV